MSQARANIVFDFVVIGSGFGGSVSAMRLAEKGYRVLVLERGKRYHDEDFATSNWHVRKYLWLPQARCFGILQLTPFRNVVALHGVGVGGGSLGYANVLTAPDAQLFDAPAWRHLADWRTILEPHYATARRMLGVSINPRMWPADRILQGVARDLGQEAHFAPTAVGVYFGESDVEAPDPYFGGEGPARRGCRQCGACMVGCRHNAKNTLVKNYLYFAERWGAEVRAESEVVDLRPLPAGQPDGARFAVVYRRSTALRARTQTVRARNVVLSGGVIGTLDLLFRCRDVTRSLPALSPRLGDRVRTNSESLTGVIGRGNHPDYSEGIAITSILRADDVTCVEPVRYPAGSSLMRFLAGPMIEAGNNVPERLAKVIGRILRHPLDSYRMFVGPGWASRTTILLAMQTVDSFMQVRYGRHPLTLFRRGLVSEVGADQAMGQVETAHTVTYALAAKNGGIPAAAVTESLFNVPITAHILGGAPMGRNAGEGVIDMDCQVHNYPGLYIVDGSIMPANPGVNPSLTITAMAEYAMSRIPASPNNSEIPRPALEMGRG